MMNKNLKWDAPKTLITQAFDINVPTVIYIPVNKNMDTPRTQGSAVCRNLLSIDSRLNRIDPSTNIFPPNPERGYRTKVEILLEEVFTNSIE